MLVNFRFLKKLRIYFLQKSVQKLIKNFFGQFLEFMCSFLKSAGYKQIIDLTVLDSTTLYTFYPLASILLLKSITISIQCIQF